MRYQVRSWSSDQGADAEVADCPVLITELSDKVRETMEAIKQGELQSSTAATNVGYFLPLCIRVPDVYHVLYNPLEESVCKLDEWGL